MDQLFRWVAIHHDGTEGTIACSSPMGFFLPMVCSDERMAEKMKERAIKCSTIGDSVKSIELRVYTYEKTLNRINL